MKNIYSRHLRDFVFRALLSLLTCVAGTLHAGAVTPRNPIAKVTNLIYTKTNTIVTLKLWMYNYDGGNAHFVGDVWLTIDGEKRKSSMIVGSRFPMWRTKTRSKISNGMKSPKPNMF